MRKSRLLRRIPVFYEYNSWTQLLEPQEIDQGQALRTGPILRHSQGANMVNSQDKKPQNVLIHAFICCRVLSVQARIMDFTANQFNRKKCQP